MCGIIAVVRSESTRPVPTADEIEKLLEAAGRVLAETGPEHETLDEAARLLETINGLLGGLAGVQALLQHQLLAGCIGQQLSAVDREVMRLEAELDAGRAAGSTLEALNAAIIRLKDASWAIGRDRLRTARAVADLCGPDATATQLAAMLSIQEALSALDRLEVRGRDSAGLHVMVRHHGLDLDDPAVVAALDRRNDALFGHRTVRVVDGLLSFVYKAAAEIGELGDNTAVLRAAIADDDLLRRSLLRPEARAVVLGHTRWASVGIISESNAHPLNSQETGRSGTAYCVAALNGDVDNFADLTAAESLSIAPEITTDAKVIPTLMARHLDAGESVTDAFRATVAAFEGSVAIGAATAQAPERIQLALRGSGQALYVGLADDAYIVASEPYGLVETTSRYLRVEGETPGNPDNPIASRGQIIDLDGDRAGSLAGIVRQAYDGTDLPVTEADVVTAEITTRDIDRGDAPHYLLKEITEAPGSFRKTLRGKLVEVGDQLAIRLDTDTIPADVAARVQDGTIKEVLVIGQGTAAVAGESLAAFLADELRGRGLRVEALPATELSGFGMRADMSDTLAIAISQSGTTTDTNRTVDLIRARGAAVLAIVNRRNSDLTDKADGVLYTSDGRDVEMSVASTKAFYAQIAAGLLLATHLAELFGVSEGADDRQDLLQAIRALPEAMERTLTLRPDIAIAAAEAPAKRYWAVVGNGSNHIAARELRIKLSELCYKSIAVDHTEDKKHIDLSAEPLILVCAAGLVGSTADDVAKEVAIYRAHKATPIVIASEGSTRFAAAHQAIMVPAVHPRLDFVLATVVGHLFGYEAARAIDALADPLRESRAAIEHAASEVDRSIRAEALLAELRPAFREQAARFYASLRDGSYNGALEASSAVRLALQYRFALGTLPLDAYQLEFGKVGTPSVVLEDLVTSLTLAIDELTRPIDAIKHQAKTVTVGISRSDETLLQVALAAAVLDAGAPRDQLTYRSLRTLADLDPAVAEVRGYTRYRIEGDVRAVGVGAARAVVVDRGGIALGIQSRTERDPSLRGTKRRVATEQRLLVNRGASDGRSIILVPEVKDGETTGITLMHVRFHDQLGADIARGVLQGYRNRYAALRDAVTETEPTFRDDLLGELGVIDLLTGDVSDLAARWRA